ncbi:hypothetical protein [Isorropodon fossajaponicum symbiont]|uniref:hypothetical protein n=1 Tax=Isorropodon fossajaponicum symbiont TaxID=883811 RepID=UPI001CEC1D6B|nr:hypothetical protein [Isorropodon fossajaponicum symbiont]
MDVPETFFLNDVENKNPDKNDASLFLPPPLASQIVPRIEKISNDIYKVNDWFFSAIEIQMFPTKSVNFEELKALTLRKKMSAYINFVLLPDGFDSIRGDFKTKMARFAGSVTFDDEAKYLGQVLSNAKKERNSTAIQWDISFFSKDINKLEADRSILSKYIVGWGGSLPDMAGDVLRTILTSLGLKRTSIAPKACTVPSEIAPLLPLLTTKKPFSEGNILFRTVTGHIYPYSTQMSRQSGATLIYGPMGYSKSVLLGQIVKSVVNDAALKSNQLPKIAFIDIAKSPSGIIPFLKNVIKPEMREEISHTRLNHVS